MLTQAVAQQRVLLGTAAVEGFASFSLKQLFHIYSLKDNNTDVNADPLEGEADFCHRERSSVTAARKCILL